MDSTVLIVIMLLALPMGGGYYGTRSGCGGLHDGGGVIPGPTRLARNRTPRAGVLALLARMSPARAGSAT